MIDISDKIDFHSNYSNELDLTQIELSSLKAISAILKSENVKLESLSIIWVTDSYLKELHADYLDDPTVTDVMTFNYSDSDTIDAELYISIDRAKEQAPLFNASFEDELLRLVIHGVLHMSGYDDLNEADQKVMRQKEDFYLKQA